MASLILGFILVPPGISADPQEDSQIQRKKIELLETQIRALEARVKALESRLGASSAASTASSGSAASSISAASAASAAPAAPAAAAAVPPQAAPAPGSPLREDAAQALLMEAPKLADVGQYEQARARLAELTRKYPGTKAAGQVDYFIREFDLVGKPAPADWGLEKWFQGEKSLDLSCQKTTLVVFWEEWCPHCKEEMPRIEKIHATYRAQGVQVLGLTKLTQTATEEKVRTYIGQNGISFPVAKENGSMSVYFAVGGIPAAVILKGGKVVWRGHPIRLTDEALKHWM